MPSARSRRCRAAAPRIIGVVLNRVDFDRNKYYYSRYYGYQYKSYYGQPPRVVERAPGRSSSAASSPGRSFAFGGIYHAAASRFRRIACVALAVDLPAVHPSAGRRPRHSISASWSADRRRSCS